MNTKNIRHNTMRLKSKVAILTAGASGIGLATSKLFAMEGARVIIADINEKEGEKAAAEIRSAGGEAVFIRTDVSVAKDVEHLVERTVDEFGRVDVLFNGVGINMGKPVTDCTLEDFDTVMALNLRSVFLACKYVLPHLITNETGGVIVNNASMGGLVGRPGDPLYIASKHAVKCLTESFRA